MKRIIAYLLLAVFTVLSTNLPVSVHYCGGVKTEIGIYKHGECSCETKGMDDGCCSNIQEYLAIHDVFLASARTSITHTKETVKTNDLVWCHIQPRLCSVFIPSRTVRVHFLADPPQQQEIRHIQLRT